MKKYILFLGIITSLLSACKKDDQSAASFTFILNPTELGTEVTFTPDDQDASKYHWDFGDGQKSPDKNPVHVYNNLTGSEKVYTVQLTMNRGNGSPDVSSKEITIAPNYEGTAQLKLTIRDDSNNPVPGATVVIHRNKEDWMNKVNPFGTYTADANGIAIIDHLPEIQVYYNVYSGVMNNRFTRTFYSTETLVNGTSTGENVKIRDLTNNEKLLSRNPDGSTKAWLITALYLAENAPAFHYPVTTDMYDDGRWIDSNDRYGLWWFSEDGTIIYYDYFTYGSVVESELIELTETYFEANINFFGINIITKMKAV